MDRYNAIYARQSIDKADSISIESQIELCSYEARGEEFKVFYDKGYSGKNTDRPQFQNMLTLIEQGKIKRVICYKLDRISRSIIDFATMMELFEQYGVEFVSCTERFDTSTPMGRAMLNICIVFAQLERETIQQRVTDAYISRSRKGFYMGGRVPFGYRLEPYFIGGKKTSRYAVEPEEAKIVHRIYSLYVRENTSCMDIVKHFKEKKIKNSRTKNGEWDRSRISEMIKNPIYVRADADVYNFFKSSGAVLHNNLSEFCGTNGIYLYSPKGKREKSPAASEQHVVLAPHEGIIPSSLWLAAIEKCMKNTPFTKSEKGKNSWLCGKIKCAKCGYALVIRRSGRQGKRYFFCSHKIQTVDCEGVGGISADELEKKVYKKMLERFSEQSDKQLIPKPDKWKKLSVSEKKEMADKLISVVFASEKGVDIRWAE